MKAECGYEISCAIKRHHQPFLNRREPEGLLKKALKQKQHRTQLEEDLCRMSLIGVLFCR